MSMSMRTIARRGRAAEPTGLEPRIRIFSLCGGARSQVDHFLEHPQTVSEKADFAAVEMIPTHANFAHAQSSVMRQIKQFDVETEAIGFRAFTNWATRIEPKRL
jgi:hypothetical protein